MRGALTVAAILSMIAAAAHAQDDDRNLRILAAIRETALELCPPVEMRVSARVANFDAHADASLPGLIKKLLNLKVGAAAQYETERSEGVLRSQLAQVVISTNQCRVDVLTKLTGTMMGAPPPTLKPNVSVRSYASHTRRLSQIDTPRLIRIDYLSSSDSTDNLSVASKVCSEAREQSQRGPVLKVFLKNNLTTYDVVAMARALPTFDVQLGQSTIDPRNAADTLFVNRDKVSEDEVIRVISTLKKLGIAIKSVQQERLGGRRELQLGTLVLGINSVNNQVFQSSPPLNPLSLEKLRGNEFWRAAMNGKAFCPTGRVDGSAIGKPCQIDANGRPSLVATAVQN